MVQIRLLGGVSASTASGEPIDVGPAKCQALLAALALSPGSAMPVTRLVELVWGDEPPRTAEKTLQTYATRLRKGLGETAIVRVGSAYRLDVAGEAVDVERFRHRLEEDSVEAALEEWSGVPLAGLDAPGLRAVADGLVEQWLGAMEADLERQVDEHPGEAVAQLTALTDEHPFRERLWALLMTALYRTGRQADALAAYREARRRLVDELGVEPGPELRALEAAVLAHDPGLATPLAPLPPGSGPPPSRPSDRSEAGDPSGNLPRRHPPLVGRHAELASVATALDESPVVTLVGPGGIGKTTLALAVARAAQEERVGTAWLVELAEVTSSAEVARAVANVVHVSQGPGESLIDAMAGTLEHRQALLVLDNAEHVLDGVAEVASALADRCGEVALLVTSRERLGIDVEQVVVVAPLEPTGAAVELFAERARATSGTVDLDACRAEVEEICRRLDGIPLAIELAAARTTALSPGDLLERLDDQLGLLAGGRPRGGDRHRTLRAAIQWSADLLSVDERRVLARLAVFSGPFDLSAAEAVAADPTLTAAGIDAAVTGLVDQSMLITEPGPFGHRFRLLEVIRQFAHDHLADEELGAAGERHTRWTLAQVQRIGLMLTGWEEIDAVDRLAELWPNLRAAVDRAIAAGDALGARDLVAPVAPEVFLRSQSEIADWVERILDVGAGDEELVAWGLTWASRRAMRNRDPDAYERLVDRHGEPDDPLVHHARAFVAQDQEALLRWCPPCADELRRRGEDHLALVFEIGSARALLSMGRDAEGDELLRPLLDRFRRDGPPTFLNWALSMLGYAAMRQGRRDEAEALFEEAVAVAVPAGTHSRNKPILARTALRRGDRHEALRQLRGYVEDLIELDDLHETRTAAADLVLLATNLGRRQAVARLRRHLESPDGEPGLDDRRALRHMADVLDQLLAEV